MKAFAKLLLGCAVVAAIAMPASAQIGLSLTPVTNTIPQGGTASYNLNISGLQSDVDYTQALGGYFVQLDYGTSVASVQSVTFGNSLFNLDPNGNPDYQSVDTTTTPGVISLVEMSNNSTPALEGAQGKSFTLATITFQGVAPGTTPVTIDANLKNPILSNTTLTDEGANTLDLVNVTNASLTVIPEPSVTASVFGAVALGFCMLRRRFARNANCIA